MSDYWESPSQKPEDLKASAEHPAPWKISYRGNGHHDLLDANGKLAAYVFCWDTKDYDALGDALERINSGDAESTA